MLGTLGLGFSAVLGILDFGRSKVFRNLDIECSGHQGCTPDRPKSMFPVCMPNFTCSC